MIETQGQSFWWDSTQGSFCSTVVMGGLGQFITPAEIATASGVTLTEQESAALQLEFESRTEPDAYSTACKMTRLRFIERFTPTETKGILAASKVNADLELYLWKMQQALDVDLLDPSTIIGVQTLEAAGLLATGRAAQILRAP